MRLICFLAFVLATPAVAQSGGACDPVGSASGSVGKAQFSIQRAAAAVQNNRNAIRDLQDVLRTLSEDKSANPLARNYLLGETYILFLTQPGITVESPRAALGLTTDPAGTINLLMAADSAFNTVERLAPNCISLMNQLRQQSPWVHTLNAALNALNAGSFDSAEFYAKRALLIERRAPYAYSVLGSVASQRKDVATANEYWAKALAAAGSDSAYADVKVKTMFEMADAASAQVNRTSGADKVRLAREAIKSWQNYMALTTDDLRLAETIDRLVVLYKTAGDSASIPSIYASIISNPSRYGENALVHAGVAATRTGRVADAIKLFDAARTLNPYSRDALYNLALSYYASDQPAKMFPLVKSLIEIDPSNPDDELLYAFAYQSLYKTTKDKKLQRLYTDSLVYFNSRSENATVKVSITDFTRGEKETTLGGTVENRSKTTKSYPLSIQFFDKSGAVLGSQDVSVGPVAPKATQKFKVSIPKGGVYGFRYKPLT